MPLDSATPAFPGDPPFASVPAARRAQGAPFDLSILTFGSHAGTHVDPPAHFFANGASVDRLDLATLNGPSLVVQIPGTPESIGPEALTRIPAGTERLLLQTANSARWAHRLEFFPDFVGLSADGARFLRTRGVRLVGIDALSIERGLGPEFPAHRELLGHGVPIVEGLLLDGVEPGAYRLHCLPLRIRDGDGGPARVALSRPRRGPELGA